MTDHALSIWAHYNEYISKVDLFCTDVKKVYDSSIICSKGCDSCCRHLSLFPVEAIHMRVAMDTCSQDVRMKIIEKAEASLQAPQGDCPLLDQGECLLYEVRPMICRTHGYPILVEEGGEFRVDHCPLNFRSGETIDRRFILDLNTLNTALATINRLFVNDCLGGQEIPDRLLLAEALLMDMDMD